jgi:hypothetical protein
MHRLLTFLRSVRSRRAHHPLEPQSASPDPGRPSPGEQPYPLGPRIAPPSPDLPSTGGMICGSEGSSGLLLFQSCDENGRPTRPTLVIAEPDGTVRARIDISEPAVIWSARSGCRGLVRTGSGATFVVDGTNGTAIKLDLGDPTYVMEYQAWAGGGRWGFFGPPVTPLGGRRRSDLDKLIEQRREWPFLHRRSALIDFATGAVTDMRDIYSAQFSPDGETLAVDVRPEQGGARAVWLILVRDPHHPRARPVGDQFENSVDFDGDRLLYREQGDDWERLVLVNLAEGNQTIIAQARRNPKSSPSVAGFCCWLAPARASGGGHPGSRPVCSDRYKRRDSPRAFLG